MIVGHFTGLQLVFNEEEKAQVFNFVLSTSKFGMGGQRFEGVNIVHCTLYNSLVEKGDEGLRHVKIVRP